MPHAEGSASQVEGVPESIEALRSLVLAARPVREERGIEYALTRADLSSEVEAFNNVTPAIVEAAARSVFYTILVCSKGAIRGSADNIGQNTI